MCQGIAKPVVFFLVQGTIDVIGGAFAVARRKIYARHVNGIGFDDRADRVVEIKVAGTGEAGNLVGESIGSQRTGGDDSDLFGISFIDASDLFANNFDLWLIAEPLCDFGSKGFAI